MADVLGELVATIQQRSQRDAAWMLRYTLTLPRPIDTIAGAGDLSADGIDFGVRSWRELGGRIFTFPTDPVRIERSDGESIPQFAVVGTLAVAESYEALRVRTVVFGAPAGNALPVTVTGFVVFDPHTGERAPLEIEASGTVRLGAAIVRSQRASDPPLTAEDATAIAARFLDLADYREPRIVDGAAFYDPRLDGDS